MKTRWVLGLCVVLGIAVVISVAQARAGGGCDNSDDWTIPPQHDASGAWVDWCLLCHGPYGEGVIDPPGPLWGKFLMFPTRDCTDCHYAGSRRGELLLPDGYNRCSGTGGCHPWPEGFDPTKDGKGMRGRGGGMGRK